MSTEVAKPIPVAEAVRSLPQDEAARMKRLLERGVNIPPAPRAGGTAPTPDAQGIRRACPGPGHQPDPGLSAMLFKVVGNAAYKQHQPFASVEEILHAVGCGRPSIWSRPSPSPAFRW